MNKVRFVTSKKGKPVAYDQQGYMYFFDRHLKRNAKGAYRCSKRKPFLCPAR